MPPSSRPFSRRSAVVISLWLLGAFCSASARAQTAPPSLEMPRAGAPRVLRLIDGQGRPLSGSLSEIAWETRGVGLFFTRESGGTRNIWRAFPDPQDSNRYPTWRALPVTQFQAPLFASIAAPIAGDRALTMVSNAANPRRAAQIVRFELLGPSLRALTNLAGGAFDPAPSPDGTTFAFAANQGGSTSVWVQSLSGGAARLVARGVRHPIWQNSGTLLVESVANRGIFRIDLSDGNFAPLLMGARISATRDGALLAIIASPQGSSTAETTPRETIPRGAATSASIYLLAGDGSGLRALSGTLGAHDPALSPDGRALAFDAPLPGENATGESANRESATGEGATRALWIVPLQPDAPLEILEASDSPDASARRRIVDNPQIRENAQTSTGKPAKLSAPLAQIAGVRRAPNGAIAILGVVGGDEARASLEIGAGSDPKHWISYSISPALAVGAPLLLWSPPANARGTYSLRLSVSNPRGAAQSLLRIRLPLDASIPAPVSTPSNPVLPSGGLLPRAPMPNLPAPPALPPLPLPAPVATPQRTAVSDPIPIPNQPRLMPAPPNRSTPERSVPERATPRNGTPQPQNPRMESPRTEAPDGDLPRPAPFPPIASVGSPYAPLPRVPATVPSSIPTPVPTRTAPLSPPLQAPPTINQSDAKDAATFNISGTLATMKAGQTIPVSFWALNQGGRGWNAGSGAGAVRLVARWVDADRNSRRKWVMQWLKTPVAPGARTNWSFNLSAPSQPGRYKLIYGLVRLQSDNYAPPAYSARQDAWPGEFAAIAFAVKVIP